MSKSINHQFIVRACTSLAGATLCATFFLTTGANKVSASTMPLPVQSNVEKNVNGGKRNNILSDSPTGTNNTVKFSQMNTSNPLLRHTEVPNEEEWGYLPYKPTGSWGNVNYYYDQSTKTLTINGGTLYSPTPIFKQIGTDVKRINIAGNLKISGDMCAFFSSLPDLTTINGIANVNTSNANSFLYTFAWDSSLTSIDLTGWDTSNVTTIDRMFDGATGLTTAKVDSWNLRCMKDISGVFQRCGELTNLDVSKWNTSNVTNMSWMFNGCSKLGNLDVSNWDTSNVTDMRGTFQACDSLNSLDVSNWNTSQVTNMAWMFWACSKLNNLDVSNWNTSQVTNMTYMFFDCFALSKLDVSKWKTNNVVDMEGMFQNCFLLNGLDVSNWNTSQVTDMSWMFYSCNKLDKLNVSNWKTSNVTDMNSMFLGCEKLTSLNVSNWNTSKVTNMEYMFAYCSLLTELDVSNWNTSNVTDMRWLFYNCSNLTKLDLSNFNDHQVSDNQQVSDGGNNDMKNGHYSMLLGLTKLRELHLGPNIDIADADLDTPVEWVSVKNGTVQKPEGTEFYSSDDLSKFWNNKSYTETWVPSVKTKIIIRYIDLDDNNKIIQSDSLSGAANHAVDYKTAFDKIVTDLKNKHYDYVASSDKIPWSGSQIKMPANAGDSVTYTVGFKHATTKVEDGDKNPVTGIIVSGLYKNVVQRIHYQGLPNPILSNNQILRFTRSGIVDLVTGKETYLDWNEKEQTFKDVDSPKIAGYVPDVATVKGATVKATDSDILKVVNYTRGNYNITINYVDGDDNDKVIKTDKVAGNPDKTISYHDQMQNIINSLNGYEVDKDKSNLPLDENGDIKLPDSVTGDKDYQVVLKHKFTTIKPGDKNPVTGKEDDNLIKEIKQTIKYSGAGKDISDNVQTVKFTRNGKVDLVTGKVEYLDWNEKEQSFKDVDSPDVTGYIANPKTIKGTTVKPTDSDVLKEVKYTRGDYNITINYVDSDDNDKVIKTDKVAGNPDKTIPYHEQMQNIVNSLNGYEVDKDKSNLPLDENGDIKLPDGVTGDKDYQVALKHKVVTINPDDKNPVTGKEDDSLTKTIKQTIKYRGADKDIPDNVQTVKFTRNGKVDLVTGKVEYLDWNEKEQSFKDVDSPTVSGYDVDLATVKGVTVKPTDSDITKTVTYTKKEAPSYDININYTDEDGKVIKIDKQKGKAGTTIQYHDKLTEIINQIDNGNYEIDKDKSDLPLDKNNDIKLPDDLHDNQDYHVVLKHKTTIIKPGDKNPVTGKEDDSLTKTIKQTIKYRGADKDIPDNVQTVKFTRNGKVDLVTGKVEYLDWNEEQQSFKDVDSPTITGYNADIKTVKGIAVKPDDNDITKTVTYTKVNSNEPDYNITINYQDENGKIIKTDQQKGKANSTIPYKDRMQDIINSIAKGGYEIDKDKSNLPLDENGDIKLPDINNDTTYKLVLKHKVLIFKHGEKNPFTGEEDPNLERKVTQTIEYHGSGQALPYNTQALIFTRSAQVDMVTGKVEYLKWNEKEQQFKDVKSPFVKGYAADLPVVKGRAVTGDSKDIVQIVTYHKSNIVQTGLDIVKNGLPTILGLVAVVFTGILSYFGITKKKK